MHDVDRSSWPTLDSGLLLECVVTTSNADGTTNIAPMGPIVDQPLTRALLRPFQTAVTFQNLVRTKHCVLHVTDDVELIARSALHLLDDPPGTSPTCSGKGQIIDTACRWYELEVESVDNQSERAAIVARVVDEGRLRDFTGFNRAMHAVIEATILATRLHLLPAEEVAADMDRLAIPIEKTGGPRERNAFALVRAFIDAG